MPIQKCTLPNGGKGYKWGKSGKCYVKREDAIKQMKAVKYQQSKSEIKNDFYKKVKNILGKN